MHTYTYIIYIYMISEKKKAQTYALNVYGAMKGVVRRRICVCVCVCVKKRDRETYIQRERERERKRERVCVCIYTYECIYII